MDNLGYVELRKGQDGWYVTLVTIDDQRSKLPGTLSGKDRQPPPVADVVKLMSEQGYDMPPDQPLPVLVREGE